MGPGAAAQLDALLNLSDLKLSEFADLYKEKQRFANQQALEELKSLREETDVQIQASLNEISDLYGRGAPAVGQSFADGLARGMLDGSPTAASAAAGRFHLNAFDQVSDKILPHPQRAAVQRVYLRRDIVRHDGDGLLCFCRCVFIGFLPLCQQLRVVRKSGFCQIEVFPNDLGVPLRRQRLEFFQVLCRRHHRGIVHIRGIRNASNRF